VFVVLVFVMLVFVMLVFVLLLFVMLLFVMLVFVLLLFVMLLFVMLLLTQVVMCGWAGERTAVICDKFNQFAAPGSSVVILSEAPIKDRLAVTERHKERDKAKDRPYNLLVIHKHGSPMSFNMVKKAVMAVQGATPQVPGESVTPL
jgi:hypothetical protein